MTKKIALLTIYQYRELYNKIYDGRSYFNPSSTPNGSYFISEDEINIYQGSEYAWIKDLPLIDYNTLMPDTTPPDLSPYAIEIPTEFQWVFVNDNITIGGFSVPLDNYNQIKVVNLAYFNWAAFRKELDIGIYADLKAALMPLWDYVALQVTNGNLITL